MVSPGASIAGRIKERRWSVCLTLLRAGASGLTPTVSVPTSQQQRGNFAFPPQDEVFARATSNKLVQVLTSVGGLWRVVFQDCHRRAGRDPNRSYAARVSSWRRGTNHHRGRCIDRIRCSHVLRQPCSLRTAEDIIDQGPDPAADVIVRRGSWIEANAVLPSVKVGEDAATWALCNEPCSNN